MYRRSTTAALLVLAMMLAGTPAMASPHAAPAVSPHTAPNVTPAAGQLPVLAAGQSASVAWQPETQSAWRVHLNSGDYVDGSLDGPPALLDLTDDAGQHVRRLVGPRALYRSYMFVAPRSGWYRFVVDTRAADLPGSVGQVPAQGSRDSAVATLTLRVGRILPADRQQAEAEGPESPRLRQLAAQLGEGGNTDAFWQAIAREGAPLIEPLDEATKAGGTPMVLATFLWRGAREGVRLLGSPAGDHDDLHRLGDSDVWYRSYRIPASTRMSYQLAPDVPAMDGEPMQRRRAIFATAQRDPLNPRVFPQDGADIYQQKSVLELPGAPAQPWIAARPGVPAGTVTRHRIESKLLGETREVYLYRPASAAPKNGGEPPALLVVFDAHAYLSLVPTPTILDNLMHEGLLPRTHALIVPNPDGRARSSQLPPNPAFADFLARELLPWAGRQGITAPPSRTVVAGSSYGGIAAAYAGLRHPERFGLVLSQSGSYWWGPMSSPAAPPEDPGWLMREYAASPTLPLRFYMDAGQFEQGRGIVNILHTTRHMRDVLRAKGYKVSHAEFASGHDYLQWRGTLACGLLALVGTLKASAGLRDGGELARACPMQE
ncbi:enterochelin esterase domain-containing protein [Paracidovorax citrulli]